MAALGKVELTNCTDVDEEFKAIKQVYFKAILQHHPDKGGDPAKFRDIQVSFEVLRELYSLGKIATFGGAVGEQNAHFKRAEEWFESTEVPSWEFYAEAAAEPVPIYRMERAKSNRSRCQQQGAAKKCVDQTIPKGTLRLGTIDDNSGTYGRWCHLVCWRVPNSVWLGLPNPETCSEPKSFEEALERMNEVLLSGFSDLSPQDRSDFVAYVMDKSNWARSNRKGKARFERMQQDKHSENSPEPPLDTAAIMAVKPKEKRGLVVPKPGVGNAKAGTLIGATMVLTGIFPELGGGCGLNLGKQRAKALVESFGGRVTSAVSGKTTHLLVGQEPGFSKVSQARQKPGVQLIGLGHLVDSLEGKGSLEDAPFPKITSFSTGYRGNSLALTASDEDLKRARGDTGHAAAINQKLLPEAKRARGRR